MCRRWAFSIPSFYLKKHIDHIKKAFGWKSSPQMERNHSIGRPTLSKLSVNGSKSKRGAPHSLSKFFGENEYIIMFYLSQFYIGILTWWPCQPSILRKFNVLLHVTAITGANKLLIWFDNCFLIQNYSFNFSTSV